MAAIQVAGVRNAYPIELMADSNYSWNVDLLDVDGTPYDLTGCELYAEVRDCFDRLLFTLQAAIANALNGKLVLTAPVASNDLAGLHYWDLAIFSPTGIDRIGVSKFRIRPSISRKPIALSASITIQSNAIGGLS